jgi:hypothetical protein
MCKRRDSIALVDAKKMSSHNLGLAAHQNKKEIKYCKSRKNYI